MLRYNEQKKIIIGKNLRNDITKKSTLMLENVYVNSLKKTKDFLNIANSKTNKAE